MRRDKSHLRTPMSEASRDKKRAYDKARFATQQLRRRTNPPRHPERYRAQHSKRPPTIEEMRIALDVMDNMSSDAAYLLGLLWADGYHLSLHGIGIELADGDFADDARPFGTVGTWKVTHRARAGRRPQTGWRMLNRPLRQYLNERGFEDKSLASASGLISDIPKALRRYWWRGYFDGDGCIYAKPERSAFQVSFAGAYEQDLSFITDQFPYATVQRRRGERHSYSSARFTGRARVRDFLHFIYPSGKFDGLGLRRKFDKLLLVHQGAKSTSGMASPS